MTIDVPDDILLHVFDHYVAEAPRIETWHTLVHVCRQWRTLVFESPRRLDLRIECTDQTAVREKLDVWPAFPIVISMAHGTHVDSTCVDNIKALLEYNDRVCQIEIPFATEDISAALEKPFPALTDMYLWSDLRFGQRVNYSNPYNFLGGSSLLRSLRLKAITIPELPKLLLSCTDLVELDLSPIEDPKLIPSEAIYAILSSLTKLEVFSLLLILDDLLDDSLERQNPPPPTPSTRFVLPALTHFQFLGSGEYLEELMSRIDGPLLNQLYINFNRLFETPQFVRFISNIPEFLTPHKASMGFDDRKVWIKFFSPTGNVLRLSIGYNLPYQRFQRLAQFCRAPLPSLLTLESLYIGEIRDLPQRHRRENAETTQWLELFQSFSNVKRLFISKAFAPRIAPVLQELVGEKVLDVLPVLKSLYLEELRSVQEAIWQFVATRQLLGHSVAVFQWDRKGSMILGRFG